MNSLTLPCFHAPLLAIESHNAMRETVQPIVPDPIGLQIKTEYMVRIGVVLECICVFVASAAYHPAHHADPIVLRLRALGASQ